jgi:hypothetical protein
MPTNEERREVARKLRETSDEIRDWCDTNPYWYVMKCIYGDVEIHDDNELFYRLADLIEPEPEWMCHNLSEFQDCDCFTCSNCGESYEMRRLEYDIDEYCTLDDAIKALDYDGCDCDVRYCPNCGAEVV